MIAPITLTPQELSASIVREFEDMRASTALQAGAPTGLALACGVVPPDETPNPKAHYVRPAWMTRYNGRGE